MERFKKLIGDLFIVPNMLLAWGKSGLGKSVAKHHAAAKNLLGYEPTATTTFAEIWLTGSGVDNWTAHGIDGQPPGWGPMFLPAEALYKAGEGGKIIVPWDDDKYEFELTIKCMDYRYKSHGAARTILNTLKAKGMNYTLTMPNETWIAEVYPEYQGRNFPPVVETW